MRRTKSYLQSFGQLAFVSAQGQPTAMQTISSQVPLPQRSLQLPPRGGSPGGALPPASPGHGANAHEGPDRPTVEPSGHTFASFVQATPGGVGEGPAGSSAPGESGGGDSARGESGGASGVGATREEEHADRMATSESAVPGARKERGVMGAPRLHGRESTSFDQKAPDTIADPGLTRASTVAPPPEEGEARTSTTPVVTPTAPTTKPRVESNFILS
jgi:hypothetical protein